MGREKEEEIRVYSMIQIYKKKICRRYSKGQGNRRLGGINLHSTYPK